MRGGRGIDIVSCLLCLDSGLGLSCLTGGEDEVQSISLALIRGGEGGGKELLYVKANGEVALELDLDPGPEPGFERGGESIALV